MQSGNQRIIERCAFRIRHIWPITGKIILRKSPFIVMLIGNHIHASTDTFTHAESWRWDNRLVTMVWCSTLWNSSVPFNTIEASLLPMLWVSLTDAGGFDVMVSNIWYSLKQEIFIDQHILMFKNVFLIFCKNMNHLNVFGLQRSETTNKNG